MEKGYEAPEASTVLTIEEIANLTRDSAKPADTLMNVVALIASRFHSDVCSAYLLEPDRSHLVLAATVGLDPRCIGTLRMLFERHGTARNPHSLGDVHVRARSRGSAQRAP